MKQFETTIPLDDFQQKYFSKMKREYSKKTGLCQLTVWTTHVVINQDTLPDYKKMLMVCFNALPFPAVCDDELYPDFLRAFSDIIDGIEKFMGLKV